MMRQEMTFEVGDALCAATLFLPEGAGPHPVVVMGHGLGGVAALLTPYAERFVAAGMACFVFDYRHFGSSGGEPRHLFSVKRQLEDWQAAVAKVKTLPGVDASRLALWGTSFGGGHAMTIAVRHPGVRAVVAQCPAVDFRAIVWRTLWATPGSFLRLLAAALRDVAASLFGRVRYVPLVGAPGTLAAMTAAGAVAGVAELVATLPASVPFVNTITPRFMLGVALYRPIVLALRLQAPLLVSVCDRDTVAPPDLAVAAAKLAPAGKVSHHACDHFQIYLGEHFERAVTEQAAFLRAAIT